MIDLVGDSSGKVREKFDLRDGRLLFYATERASAFDVILEDLIPQKGRVLNGMSEFWCGFLDDIVPTHFITSDMGELPRWFMDQVGKEGLKQLDGSAMIVRKGEVVPIEAIVRGYLSGSGWASYKKDGTVCGIQLPQGLVESDKIPGEPLFTPSTKAPQGEHDVNISYEEMIVHLADHYGISNQEAEEKYARPVRDYTLRVYQKAALYALRCGIIIADTKLEFVIIDGKLYLGDEILTPDSSRFWPLDTYLPGRSQPSLDKQPVRDDLQKMINQGLWDKNPPAPHLTGEAIQATTKRYVEAYERLTGKKFIYR